MLNKIIKTKAYNLVVKYIATMLQYIIASVKHKLLNDFKKIYWEWQIDKVDEHTDWVVDLPDTRDLEYKDIWGKITWLPAYVYLKDSEIQDQSLQEETKYWCVFYSTSTAINTMNYLVQGDKYISWLDLTKVAIGEGKLYKFWAYLIDWPKLAKKYSYIDWYSKAVTVNEMKEAIANWNIIITWSKKINWSKARQAPYLAEEGSDYAHCVAIVGYDDRQFDWWAFVIEQSYWKDRFEKWYMYIKYSDIHLLFSRYVLHSNDKIMQKLMKFRKEIAWENSTSVFNKLSKLTDPEDKRLFQYAIDLKYKKRITNK